jgi:hypothetical protein
MQRYANWFRDSEGRGYPGAIVTVYVAGTSTLADIYYAQGAVTTPNAKQNPFTTDSNGFFDFAAAGGSYDIVLSGSNVATTYLYNQALYDMVSDPNTNVIGLLADTTSAGNGDALIGVKQPFTGTTPRTQHDKNAETISVLDFGAVGDGLEASKSANTTAFNAAILAASNDGKKLLVPSGTYVLDTLATVRDKLDIVGDGYLSILKFSTGAIGLEFNPTVNDQAINLTVRDVTFTTGVSNPSSVLKITMGTNALFERCRFIGNTATYIVDHAFDYGCMFRDCVFSWNTVTACVIFRNNPTLSTNEWSMNSYFSGCDFSHTTGDHVHIECGLGPYVFENCVMESATGGAIKANLRAGYYTWNIHIRSCGFEANIGYDLDISGGANASRAKVEGCVFTTTGSINLGDKGVVTVENCSMSGGDNLTIYGSGSAIAVCRQCYSVTKSGTFSFSDDTIAQTYTPNWGADSVTPSIGNGSITGKYMVNGKRITGEIYLTIGSTTTFGSGNWFFSLPSPYTPANSQIASSYVYDSSSTIPYVIQGAVTASSTNMRGWLPSGTGSISIVSPTVPITWATGDTMTLAFDYWIN